MKRSPSDAPDQSNSPAADARLAIEDANIPTLLAVLHQLTGQDEWLSDKYQPTRPKGMDDNRTGGLSDDAQAHIRAATLAAYAEWQDGKAPAYPTLSDEQISRILNFTAGEPIPDEFTPLIAEILESGPDAPLSGPQQVDTDLTVLVIGAGIAGMLASKRLTDAGVAHTVIEKNSGVGGSWWENTYPGAGVDTPSYLYSFSFFHRDWSTYFGKRDEVNRYLQDFADHFDLRKNIEFDTEVVSAHYRPATNTWEVETLSADGTKQRRSADIVISGVGVLNRPKLPSIEGIDTFTGQSFHTAEWPDDVQLEGKRVALIGAGASAMQVGPAIAGTVEELTVFQRSPQWIAPNGDYFRPVAEGVHWLMNHMPFYHNWYRARLSWIFNDKVHPTLQIDEDWEHSDRSVNPINDGHRRFYTRYIESQLEGHEDLLSSTIPDYPPFGKRMLLDNGWYRMLTRDDVQLVTAGVDTVTETGLIDSNGQAHDFDVIIYATGFHADRYLHPMNIVGKSGQSSKEVWRETDASAYLGITVPNFPNFFIMTGPNTGLGHGGSFITVLECQTRYIMDLIGKMIDQDIVEFECKPDVADEYRTRVDDAHSRMVWTHPGMTNWYRNSDGRVVAVMPWRILDYWKMTNSADLDDFTVTYA